MAETPAVIEVVVACPNCGDREGENRADRRARQRLRRKCGTCGGTGKTIKTLPASYFDPEHDHGA